ncbi:MAG: DNA topoisomerase IV subunit B [Candidatus Colwellbacteria bacterium CG_4_9_14_0_2_um_filter_50_12]|uniref:DNA topoisomerase (ATP-hydrolyzing) n=1 Tax=Candidatus Colwellbacteria bacterium CG_4_9_14_0_2_um_filter_50_12 TaxID=1974538 RepID=A0A2M8G110_9BACT|nr:MAG: DNA topoisomerase IV subunit B [Candidatus Colwellbacteria bacterium CG_4_9_14_0_2_um_filter_50_12]
MSKDQNKESYTAKDILVLEGLEPVRKRPGMYVGSTGPDGLHHLIKEVVDNSRDEAMAGFAKNISVTMLPDGRSVEVSDDGRGIPVDIHSQTKKSALETVLTTLHAGGKFGGGSYKVSGGLHGVGVSVVNALSSDMKVEVCRDGKRYVQEYSLGVPKYKVKEIGKAETTGTTVTFTPDEQVFGKVEFDCKRVLGYLREQAYLTKGVRIIFSDLRSTPPFYYGFRFEGGIKSFLDYLNIDGDKSIQDRVFYVDKEYNGINVEVAFSYNDGIETSELAFANNVHNPEGGMHLTGFKSALTRTLNDYARSEGYIKEKEENLSGEDVREGLTAIVSVKILNPQFEGQTKAKLGNPEARTAVETVVNVSLKEFLEKYKSDAEHIIGKCLLAAKARKAAKAAKDTILRKGALEGLTLPGKLADCQSKKAEDAELFIVEGDSAGGSAKQARDRRTQAILPLRGKILNVEKSRLDKMLMNKEITALIVALGTAIAEEFDIAKLRYHKIILMTDADVDGAHIRTLLLSLFYRHFLPVINGGYLYIAQPPLYHVQSGKNISYAWSDDEKDSILKDLKGANANVQRYKGLGEMNPEQLRETTMDPGARILKQVTIEDAREADRMFDILMGSDVMPRKHFIMTRGHLVSNLDL